jgi:hypothetical protein
MATVTALNAAKIVMGRTQAALRAFYDLCCHVSVLCSFGLHFGQCLITTLSQQLWSTTKRKNGSARTSSVVQARPQHKHLRGSFNLNPFPGQPQPAGLKVTRSTPPNLRFYWFRSISVASYLFGFAPMLVTFIRRWFFFNDSLFQFPTATPDDTNLVTELVKTVRFFSHNTPYKFSESLVNCAWRRTRTGAGTVQAVLSVIVFRYNHSQNRKGQQRGCNWLRPDVKSIRHKPCINFYSTCCL